MGVNGESASLPSEILIRVRRNMVLFPGQILIGLAQTQRQPKTEEMSGSFRHIC